MRPLLAIAVCFVQALCESGRSRVHRGALLVESFLNRARLVGKRERAWQHALGLPEGLWMSSKSQLQNALHAVKQAEHLSRGLQDVSSSPVLTHGSAAAVRRMVET